MKQFFVLNGKTHPMKTKYEDKYEVNFAHTEIPKLTNHIYAEEVE